MLGVLSCLYFNCHINAQQLVSEPSKTKHIPKTKIDKKQWYLLDLETDATPGISLQKAREFIADKKSDTIVIAVLDTAFDLEHEDLNSVFWTNEQEKANKLDDDGNGLVDDIYGWNYLAGSGGANPIYQNYEVVRVVRFYEDYFNRNSDTLSAENKANYLLYKRAKKVLNKKRNTITSVIEQGKVIIDSYYKGLETIKSYLNGRIPSISLLDSIAESDNPLKDAVDAVKLPLLYDMNIADLEEDLEFRKRQLNMYYATEFKERQAIGDNSDDLGDIGYGNGRIDNVKDTISHGTNVTGIIASNTENGVGITGIVPKVKIIPLVVAVNGEAHDKDLALAITYAVDKGAKIINISINKEFSLHKQWVFDALKYAAKKDVLVITAAGNDNRNLDKEKNHYPNDTDYHEPEFIENFLMIGGSTEHLDDNLKYTESNYGPETVDIMAPAKNIYTTSSNDTYELVDGTSFAAPIVTGVAGLLRSHYPNFSAKEIKSILMESGTRYAGNVLLSNDGEEKMVSFSSISKSGRIVNAYNALLLAEKRTEN